MGLNVHQLFPVIGDSIVTTRAIFSSSNLADFPQIGRLAGWWEVRLRCSAYSGGSFNLSVSQ